jgi:hypothetical protein
VERTIAQEAVNGIGYSVCTLPAHGRITRQRAVFADHGAATQYATWRAEREPEFNWYVFNDKTNTSMLTIYAQPEAA